MEQAPRSHQRPRCSPPHSFPSPSSSSSSSSSSDFEFTVSLSPSSRCSTLCPADELFYKGQLLPLHLSPRISMVRTLLLSSSSSSDATTTASRDSTASSSSSFSTDLLLPDSSRPSSVTEDDVRPITPPKRLTVAHYFSSFASRFLPRSSKKSSPSHSAKEVFKKYVKKVKPLFSKKVEEHGAKKTFSFSFSNSQSFSGNLRCPRRRTCARSCPSSMRSSPSHSGLLYAGGVLPAPTSSSMEELQTAIQGAIAHCKSTMMPGNQKTLCSLLVSSGWNPEHHRVYSIKRCHVENLDNMSWNLEHHRVYSIKRCHVENLDNMSPH
ncbi:hypothetical protein J5N97_012972 [Dioscorea zingiberensis]|uniref:Membrane-associated kinase regulator 1 n=1 Tax=Dioscorea zingiberensis TaxID=325984 RepID=A0A9D5CSM6_9LILI|nr:hypothetical protein J5N97_012972 [Dioscorea zingiberensis]